MSIENKLKYHLLNEASQLEAPHHLDSVILRNYRRQVIEDRSNVRKMNVKSLYKKVIIIAAMVVVLSGFGFAAQHFVSTSNGNLTLNLFTTDEFTRPSEELVKSYAAMQEVKAQLNEGEYAVLYRKNLSTENPFVMTYKPIEESNWGNWEQLLNDAKLKSSEDLLDGKFNFVSGIDVDPFTSTYSYRGLEGQGIDELEAQYDENEEDKLIWKKVTIDPLDKMFNSYATQYINADGQSVYVVASSLIPWHVAIEHMNEVSGGTLVGDTSFEIKQYINTDESLMTKQIGGQEVNYISYNNVVSSTGKLKSVVWLESVENQAIIYSVVTDHTQIKESTLFDIAEQLITK